MSKRPGKPKSKRKRKLRRDETHVFRCRSRTASLTIHEEADHIQFHIGLSPGRGDERDYPAFARWMRSLGARYEDDERPIVTRDPHTGQFFVIDGDGAVGLIAIVPPGGGGQP